MFPGVDADVAPAPPDEATPYGKGLPGFSGGDWRKALHDEEEAPLEVLSELGGLVFREPLDVDPRSMTLAEVTEAVRRALWVGDPTLPHCTDAFWSRPQCEAVAVSLMRDAHLPVAPAASKTPLPKLGAASSSRRHAASGTASATTTATATAAVAGSGRGTGTDVTMPGRVDIPAHRGAFAVTMQVPAAVTAVMTAQALGTRTLLNSAGFSSVMVPCRYGRYHVFDTAPGSLATPIVVLHGMFTNASSVAMVGVLLAQHRRVIMPELLGFDFTWSTCASGEFLPWADHIDATLECLKALQLRGPVDVVGHSFGGWLAVHMAQRCPHMFHRLVLLCPGGLNRYRRLQSIRVFNARRNTAMALPLPKPLPASVELAAANLLHAVAFSSTNVCMLRTLSFDQYFSRVAVHHPALLVWGTDDGLHVPLRDETRRDHVMMRDLLHDDSAGYWLEGVNHAVPVEAPVTVYTLAAKFLGLAAADDGHVPTPPPASGAGGVRLRALASALKTVAGAPPPLRRMMKQGAVEEQRSKL